MWLLAPPYTPHTAIPPTQLIPHTAHSPLQPIPQHSPYPLTQPIPQHSPYLPHSPYPQPIPHTPIPHTHHSPYSPPLQSIPLQSIPPTVHTPYIPRPPRMLRNYHAARPLIRRRYGANEGLSGATPTLLHAHENVATKACVLSRSVGCGRLVGAEAGKRSQKVGSRMAVVIEDAHRTRTLLSTRHTRSTPFLGFSEVNDTIKEIITGINLAIVMKIISVV
nr:uncharacterized protein LOC113806826 [Penaeus vannamei]